MTGFTVCNLCDQPGTFATAVDVAAVPCHVRRFNDHVFTVWRCTNCHSLHSKEQVDLAPYYRDYPVHDFKLDLAIEAGYANRLRLLEERGLKRSQSILDFGCGRGLFVQFLHRRGYANALGYDKYVPKFADPALLERRYDVVCSYDVIEHVPDPRQCMTELAQLLNVTGLLVIGTPNAEHISLDKRPYTMELSQPYHQHILSEHVLAKIARDRGLEAEHVFRRLYIDTRFPGLNTRFVWAYADACGGLLDSLVEPMRLRVVLGSAKLVFLALFGYYFPPRTNLLITFRKRMDAAPAMHAHSPTAVATL